MWIPWLYLVDLHSYWQVEYYIECFTNMTRITEKCFMIHFTQIYFIPGLGTCVDIEFVSPVVVGDDVDMTCQYYEYSTSSLEKTIYWQRSVADGTYYIWTYQGIQSTVYDNSAVPGFSRKFQHTAQSSYESFHTIKLINATKQDEGDYNCFLYIAQTVSRSSWKQLNVSGAYTASSWS